MFCLQMGFISISSVVFLCATVALGVQQPLFPEGVAPIMQSVNARQEKNSEGAHDDKANVDELLEGGVAALADDLTEQASRTDLEQAAFAQVHLRMLHQLYVGGCPRDMVGCPMNWIEADQKTCSPPINYDGICATTDLSKYSSSEKETFAWKCRASWPCVAACPKRFDGCPDAWTTAGNGVCVAPASYTGICSPTTDFSTFTSLRKAEWSAMCDAAWPCK